jgi:hypothetical protein
MKMWASHSGHQAAVEMFGPDIATYLEREAAYRESKVSRVNRDGLAMMRAWLEDGTALFFHYGAWRAQ